MLKVLDKQPHDKCQITPDKAFVVPGTVLL